MRKRSLLNAATFAEILTYLAKDRKRTKNI